jgi:murein DD-endopeptidase MepM/ murein hydrolase activator NlpD
MELRASGGAAEDGAHGSVSDSTVNGLFVLGQAVAASPLVRVELADWGYAIVLEQAVSTEAGEANGFSASVLGLRVVLTADHGGLAAGTEILVGYAEVSVRAPKPVPVEVEDHVAPPDGPGAVSARPKEPGTGAGSGTAEPPAIVRNPPGNIKPRLTKKGYVFPVYGPAGSGSFTNDFGAPRAVTIWHHGNDIFAPEGTPILAVAAGELFLVGWNDVGGQRLWLRDRQGNEFYYAHLSAFTPLAFDGSKVKAGDVIGFVGSTGDAEGTPYHLHFEIHPKELLALGYDGVVNPYEYLQAWKRVSDVRFDPAGVWVTREQKAPPASAVLLDAEDISATSGLQPESLQEVLEMPDLFAEGSES